MGSVRLIENVYYSDNMDLLFVTVSEPDIKDQLDIWENDERVIQFKFPEHKGMRLDFWTDEDGFAYMLTSRVHDWREKSHTMGPPFSPVSLEVGKLDLDFLK